MQRHARFTRRDFLLKTGKALLWAKLAPEGLFTVAQKAKQPYNPKTNPFQLNERLRELAADFGSGSDVAKVKSLFAALRRGGTEGIEVVDVEGEPPRTAIETFVKGGECTDLATLVIPLLKEIGVPGGAIVVNFRNAKKKTDHMAPYALINGRKVVIDLQSSRLGDMQQGRFTVLMSMTYDEAAAMYHRKWGDYMRERGMLKDAVVAYKRALEICGKDAYVNHKLAVLHEMSGDMKNAAKYLRRAAKLDPKRYGRARQGTYNEELQRGEQALKEGRWEDCAEHFKNALGSGERLRPQEKKIIQSYIDHCSRKIK
jgi:tetratricopeptide (TPR) repeat protein